jgi:hypothetical protein
MAYTTILNWETLRSIDSATFTGLYQAVGGPLLFPSYILKLVNNSTSLVTISKDGVTDIDVAPGNSFWLYDESKAGSISQVPSIPAGTQIFIKGAAGTGLVYLVSQYLVTN